MTIIKNIQNSSNYLLTNIIEKFGVCGILMALVLFLTILLIISIMQLVIHEFGHFLFGKLTGHKFIYFNVFNFILHKENGKLKIKKSGPLEFTGQCLMTAPNENTWVLNTLGGIILNILTIPLSILIIYYNLNELLIFISFCLFSTGIICAISNSIPLYNELNDGANFFILKKNAVAKESRFKQLEITKLLYEGKQYKEIPDELFKFIKGPPNDNISIYLLLLKYYKLLDSGEKAQAKDLITKLFFKTLTSNSLVSKEISLEKIYCDIINGKHPYIHKKVLSYLNAKTSNLTLLRIQIAYNLHNEKKFHHLIYKYLAIKDKQLYKKEDEFNINQIEKMYEITA